MKFFTYNNSSIILVVVLPLSFFVFASTLLSQAFQFPDDWNYRLVNDPQQPLSANNGDYGSTYRCYAGTPLDNFVMNLCFFNTTPNAYTLGLATGYYAGNNVGWWIWAANTNRPVREGAAVFLLPNGNLILYDVDGRVAWQSNTTNMADGGWVTLKTPIDEKYGDLVLVNTKDNIPFWESFDHPQYTLFPNQILHVSGAEVDKLVSYRSTLGGRYTMMMSTKSLDLYYKCANCPKPLKYYTLFKTTKALDTIAFSVFQNTTPSLIQKFADGTQGKFEFPNLGSPSGDYVYGPMFLRIEMDGNIKIYAFRQDSEDMYWVEAFKVFTKGGAKINKQESECQLPEKCGNFGVCHQDVCVACPSPKGLSPWTDKCTVPKLVGCSGGANVTYYKVEGVDHFNSKYTNGLKSVTLSSCESKCSLDCKCLGYFYHEETSACWVVSDLKTLIASVDPRHFGFIKLTN